MVREIYSRNELAELLTSNNKVVVVDYYAPWCTPCKRLAPFLEQAENIYKNLIFVKVNVESGEYPDVKALPTVQFVQNNMQINLLTGFDANRLTQLLNSYNQY